MCFVPAGEAALDDVIRLKDSSAVFTAKPDRGGAGKEEEEEIIDTVMGVGKNNTSKSLDSGSDAGKYEDESKHGADFYPIPVYNFFVVIPFETATIAQANTKQKFTW